MAAPHVAGAAALVLGANPSLTPAQVRAVLQSTGECPDGSVANAPTCAGHGQWQVGGLFGDSVDKDGIPEPLINALARRASRGHSAASASSSAAAASAAAAALTREPPTVSLTAPPSGATVRGTVSVSANAGQRRRRARRLLRRLDADRQRLDRAVRRVLDDGGDGPHTVTATAYDTAGLTSSDTRTVAVDNTVTDGRGHQPGAGNVAGTVTLAADSSDPAPGSGVASVQFLVDGTGVGTDTTAPYQGTWNTAHGRQRSSHDHRACHRRQLGTPRRRPGRWSP